jgi:hypothetical protein
VRFEIAYGVCLHAKSNRATRDSAQQSAQKVDDIISEVGTYSLSNANFPSNRNARRKERSPARHRSTWSNSQDTVQIDDSVSQRDYNISDDSSPVAPPQNVLDTAATKLSDWMTKQPLVITW